MDKKTFYKVGLIFGLILDFINMIFNKERIMWLELAAPVVIYVSFFAIRVIRIPQIVLEFIIILSAVLSSFYFTKYTLQIVFVCFFYYIAVLILHIFKIFPFIYEDYKTLDN